MLHYFYPLHLLSTVNARHQNVRTSGFVFIYFPTNALGFARKEGFALDGRVRTVLIVILHFCVGEHCLAAKCVVVAHELHITQLLVYFFFYRDELWVFALHWALSCLFREFVQTDLVKAAMALFALPGFD